MSIYNHPTPELVYGLGELLVAPRLPVELPLAP